jgi:hypothetical protein
LLFGLKRGEGERDADFRREFALFLKQRNRPRNGQQFERGFAFAAGFVVCGFFERSENGIEQGPRVFAEQIVVAAGGGEAHERGVDRTLQSAIHPFGFAGKCIAETDDTGNGIGLRDVTRVWRCERMDGREARLEGLRAGRMQKREAPELGETGIGAALDNRGGKRGRGDGAAAVDLGASSLVERGNLGDGEWPAPNRRPKFAGQCFDFLFIFGRGAFCDEWECAVAFAG